MRSKILRFSKKDIARILILIAVVSFSQIIIGRKIFEMGFFTDDWLFLSIYKAEVANPFLDILYAWKSMGSHIFSYAYYIGILHNFIGFDYFSYRVINQIMKILATLTLYPLILYISKNKLLAFLSTVLYAIHFSSFGLLDGPSRGGNYLAISFMNLFLLAYFYALRKKAANIFVSLGLSVGLLLIILTGSTRLFPLIVIVPLIELLNLIQNRGQVLLAAKRLFVIYAPYLLLYFFSPMSIMTQLSYIYGVLDKLKTGNWQLLLTPFAATGSMFVPRDFWPFFGNAYYNDPGKYLLEFLVPFLLIYFVLLSFIIFFISKKSLKFIIRNLIINFIIGWVVYFVANNWLFLEEKTKAAVDPGTFLIPAMIGLSVMVTCFSLFLEWKESEKKNNLFPFIFLAPIFSLIFIVLTWMFSDINSIFMGVHAYLTIPSIGVSVIFGTVLVLIYERLKLLHKFIPISLIIIILLGLFKLDAAVVDKFYTHWVNNGLKISDQQRIIDQFWGEIGSSNKFDMDNLPLIYLDTERTKYEEGIFYSEAIIWKVSAWLDLKYKGYKEGRFSLCEVMILGKEEFKYISVEDDGKVIFSSKCGERRYDTENFYAFSLEGGNLIPEREQILKSLDIQ